MTERDAAIAWIGERFNDPEHNPIDAWAMARIADDPDLAIYLKHEMTEPPDGCWCRIDVGPPDDPADETEQARQLANSRLCLVGAAAIPYQGPRSDRRHRKVWSVWVPQVYTGFVGFVLRGRYSCRFSRFNDDGQPLP